MLSFTIENRFGLQFLAAACAPPKDGEPGMWLELTTPSHRRGRLTNHGKIRAASLPGWKIVAIHQPTLFA